MTIATAEIGNLAVDLDPQTLDCRTVGPVALESRLTSKFDLSTNELPGAPSLPRTVREEWQTTTPQMDVAEKNEPPVAPSLPRSPREGWESTESTERPVDKDELPGAPSLPRTVREGWESTDFTEASVDKDELLARGWAALPESYRIPAVAPTLDEARAWCQNLAETHYENFHVATWFLPKVLRPHFHAIYAYCRVSDDLGDEVGGAAEALSLLEMWGEELDACYAGKARHPVFVALAETIRQCKIPKQPFADLLVAFRHDQVVTRYETMDEVLEYCRYSANPVGRLVLYACGEAEHDQQEKFRLSDATCSALQLANFWQDVREDYARGRVYLPQRDMEFFHVNDRTIEEGIATPEFRGLLRTEVDYARSLFEAGLPLIGMVNRELALDLDLFSRGGLEILRAIEARDYDVLSTRPAISKTTKATLALRAATAKLLPFLKLGKRRRHAALPD
jgi:squalene synthase HpnC